MMMTAAARRVDGRGGGGIGHGGCGDDGRGWIGSNECPSRQSIIFQNERWRRIRRDEGEGGYEEMKEKDDTKEEQDDTKEKEDSTGG